MEESTSRKWYMSIVPDGRLAGSTEDLDLYEAKTESGTVCLETPPCNGWQAISGGVSCGDCLCVCMYVCVFVGTKYS